AAEACRQSRRRALAAARAGRWTKALAEARRAHAICPGPESRRLLAVCHLLAGNLGQAMLLAARELDAAGDD
ncbi:MAG: hypothetical protein NUV77_27080, partial [Thermoguttaceae bacterium]|nr:hypothetical protein [Thermoguttaceae bacterium]